MHAPIRVVHITTVHHPNDPRIYYKECLSLHHAGYDVTLIAQQDAGDDADKPIRHIPLKKYANRLKRMIFGTFDAYKKVKKMNAHIYHFHDPELLPAGWLLKKKNNIVIYDIHEDYVTSIMQKRYMNKPLRKVIAKLYKWAEKFFTRKLELCLAEKYYKDMYPDGKCILNYPTINEKFLNHQRKESPLESKLLYTGNVSYERGALIHAKLPTMDQQISVTFVGKCPKKLAEKMFAVAGEQKERLEIEGIDRFIKKEDIEARYLERNWLAGIALFPPTEHYMRKELTKFFEYMNAGLPIICSDFPVWKNFVETYQCGLAVDPYDESEIKEAIAYMRNNQDIARQMGENGKKAVQEKLNWHAEEQKLLSWYQQLVKEHLTVQEKGRAAN